MGFFSKKPSPALWHVMRCGERISRVSHGTEGRWQFHYAGEKLVSEMMIVTLEDILELDPSIAELADLPEGYSASRDGLGAPWRKERSAA